jgi:SAM-dependent methyltransferase
MSDTSAPDTADAGRLFDEPALWRAEAASALGYEGLELATAVAPGAGFPAVLHALAAHLDVGAGDLVVDVGAGLGGASAWLAFLTGAQVVAVEPAQGSRVAAERLFPQLLVHDGRADELPVDDGVAAAVTAIGVCSLLADLDALLEEATRVLRPGGRLGIADLFLVDGRTATVGPNTFRSVTEVAEAMIRRGFVVVEVGCGRPEPDEGWSRAQRLVDSEIELRHGGDAAFAEWQADQDHLSEMVTGGYVMSGCVVGRSRD